MVIRGEEEDLSASSGSSVMPNIFPEALGEVRDSETKLSELRLKLSNVIKICAQDASLPELEDMIDYIERRRHINGTGACSECGAIAAQYGSQTETSGQKLTRKAYPLSSPTVKRPRGRPKKEVLAITDEVTPNIANPDGQIENMRQGELTPIIKRSRGRPRKYPRKEPPAVRRGPGRPRKTVLTSPAAAGRPRKLSQSFARDGDVELASDCSRGDESTEQSVSSVNSVSPHSPKYDERFAQNLESMPISHLSSEHTLSMPMAYKNSSPLVTPGKLFETDEEESASNQLANRSPCRRANGASSREESIQPIFAIRHIANQSASPVVATAPTTARSRPSVTDLMLQSPAIDHEVRSSIPRHVVDAIPPPPLLLQKPIPRPTVVLKPEDTARSMLEAFGLKDEDLDLVQALRAFEMEMSRRNQQAASAESQPLAS